MKRLLEKAIEQAAFAVGTVVIIGLWTAEGVRRAGARWR